VVIKKKKTKCKTSNVEQRKLVVAVVFVFMKTTIDFEYPET